MPEAEADTRREELETEVEQLRAALGSRVVIEQAKGVLAVVLDVTPDEAFDTLRAAARSNRMSIHDLADAVVPARSTAPEIEAARTRGR